jgi:FKBP-type peptidyl-prolyl cis-trans isomerase FkpA
MLKTRILLGLFLIAGVFSSCSKDGYNAEKQAEIDEALIVDFIAKNNILAKRDASGLYYEIITQGSGATVINSSNVTVNYEGKLLNGSVFDKSSSAVSFPLGNLIKGWQIGIPLIQKGGKIRLLVPSALAYGNSSPSNSIAKNSVLYFTIELINVQ